MNEELWCMVDKGVVLRTGGISWWGDGNRLVATWPNGPELVKIGQDNIDEFYADVEREYWRDERRLSGLTIVGNGPKLDGKVSSSQPSEKPVVDGGQRTKL